MKKTIFLAVLLSLLLCATAFAVEVKPLVTSQDVAVTFEIFNYPFGESTNTRLFIRNLDPDYVIAVHNVKLYDPNGDVVVFNVGTEDEYDDLAETQPLNHFDVNPLASISISVTTAMLATSSYPVPTVHTGGRYFFIIRYSAELGAVIPAEIWGFHRAVYSPRTERDAPVRYSYERWEGRVIRSEVVN